MMSKNEILINADNISKHSKKPVLFSTPKPLNVPKLIDIEELSESDRLNTLLDLATEGLLRSHKIE